MNRDIFEGQWKDLKGNVKERWGKLTDDDLLEIEGKRDQLLGFIQKRYGYTHEQAEEEINAWEDEIEAEYRVKNRY